MSEPYQAELDAVSGAPRIEGLTKEIAQKLLAAVNAPEQEIYRVSREIAEAAFPQWDATGELVRIESECAEIWSDWVANGCCPKDAINFVKHIEERAARCTMS